MTKPSLSLTEDMVMAAARAFLVTILPDGIEVFQSQANRVPEPTGPDYVVMTPTNRIRLSTNVVKWDRAGSAPVQLDHGHSVQFEVQLDIHGPSGSDLASIIATLIRDEYACANVDPAAAQPLYATDGHQAPFVNGEHQYENRWVMTVAFQIAPTVSTPQDFAATLAATISPVLGA